MTKTQFLLLFLSLIPLLQIISIATIGRNLITMRIISVAIPLFFLANYFNLLDSYINHDKNSLTILNMTRDITIGFFVEPTSLIFLGVIALIWPALSLYCNKYFSLSNEKNNFQFQIFLTAIIAFTIFTTLAKNLISTLLFYQALIFSIYFLSAYFMHKKDMRVSYNMALISLYSLFLFFLASILTYKTMGQLDFARGGIVNNNFSLFEYSLLLMLFLAGIALVCIAPIYLTYGNLYYLNPPSVIALFVISYGLLIPLILTKIIYYIFGVDIFFSYLKSSLIKPLILIIIIANLLISGIFAATGTNLKKMLIYLFFNQLIFAIFSIFALESAIYKASIIIIALILTQILIFFCIGNINLYLLGSEDKSINGIFYKSKITISLLIFGLANVVGIAPGIGLTAKYLLLKQSFSHFSFINCLIIIINSALNAVCFFKVVYPMFDKVQSKNDATNLELAKKIELNPSLILPIFLIAALIFFGFLFPGIIINFSKSVF